MRDNTGGYVEAATAVADVFVDGGAIYSCEDKYGRRLTYYAQEGGWEIPLAVLQNGASASASEIVAAALRDNCGALLVGDTSFGKGIMQAVFTFPDGQSGMQMTSEYWYTPNGTCIHGEGLAPDVAVSLDEDAIDENFNIIREKDNQLQAAIDALSEQLAQQPAA